MRKILGGISLLFVLAFAPVISGAAETNDFAELIRKGILAEEGYHDLNVAVASYSDALQTIETNRQLVATAVFRLGECYRKQGNKSGAFIQYERILREFADQLEYAQLSRKWIERSIQPPPAFVLSFGDSNANPEDNLNFPGGVTVAASGTVYVTDTKNNRIQKFTARGEFITRWGGSGREPGEFDYPQGLATDDSGNVYVADTHNHRIQKFDGNGELLGFWGQFGNRPGQFNAPYSVALDSAGNVYVADAHNHRIQKFANDGTYLTDFGIAGSAPGQLDQPKSVSLDSSGNIYVADTGTKCIQKFSGEGKFLKRWGSFGQLPGQFDVPHDVAVDRWGNIYVADADGPSHNNRVQMFGADGTVLTVWGRLGGGDGEFNFAARVAVDPTGHMIYVCDASNNRVQVFEWGGR